MSRLLCGQVVRVTSYGHVSSCTSSTIIVGIGDPKPTDPCRPLPNNISVTQCRTEIFDYYEIK